MDAVVLSATTAKATAAPTPTLDAETPPVAGLAVTVVRVEEVAVTVAPPALPRSTEPAIVADVVESTIARPRDPASETLPPEAPAVAAAEIVDWTSAATGVSVALRVSW